MRDGGGICDIHGLMEDFPAGGFVNLGGGLLEFRCGARADGNAGSFASEFFGDGAAKSFAGGRDDGYAAL